MQTVRNTEELRQALAAGHKPDQIEMAHPITKEQLDAAVATARAEGAKESTAAAVTAERERIGKIQGLARDGFEAETKAAIDGGHSPEQFAMALLTAATDRGITLDAIKKGSPPPAPATGTKPDDKGAEASNLLVAAMRDLNKQNGSA